MQDQLQSLLNQIKVIIKEENDLKQRQYDSGETFNVFEVLNLQRNEVRLHSSFIAALLDPQGSHGLKTKPLKSFLQIIDATGFLTDLPTVKIEKELPIGKITKNGEEGGRMDIVLIDKNKNAIVIENKIDALDQPKQLLRYFNYSRKHFNNFRIYYLTKLGNNPSDDSCGGKDIEYKTASYYEDILMWLNDCIKLSKNTQPVNETIKQYRTNLVEILNIMSQNSERKLLTVATAKNNIESTFAILENQHIITKKIRLDFLQKLIKLAEKYGFIGNKEEAEELADLQKGSYLKLTSSSRSSHFGIFIGNESYTDGFWYSIGSTTTKRIITRTILQQLEQIWGKFEPKRKRIDTPYGWEYFGSETGEQDSNIWKRWDYFETLRAMSDGSLLAFIEKEILQKTVELKLLEGLEVAIK